MDSILILHIHKESSVVIIIFYLHLIFYVYFLSFCRRAIADTRMVNLEPLMISYTYYVVSQTTDVDCLLKCIQKMPKMILLGE